MYRSLEEGLGYIFENRKLLENALTHSSYANENRERGLPDNERLERALCRLSGCKQCVITYDALRGLAQVLRENQFRVQAVADCSGACCTVYALLPPEPAAQMSLEDLTYG